MGWGGGQSGCEHRIEVIVKMQKNKKKCWGGVPFRGGGGRRIEVFCENARNKSRRVKCWPGWM